MRVVSIWCVKDCIELHHASCYILSRRLYVLFDLIWRMFALIQGKIDILPGPSIEQGIPCLPSSYTIAKFHQSSRFQMQSWIFYRID
jgi:hypothetical protein